MKNIILLGLVILAVATTKVEGGAAIMNVTASISNATMTAINNAINATSSAIAAFKATATNATIGQNDISNKTQASFGKVMNMTSQLMTQLKAAGLSANMSALTGILSSLKNSSMGMTSMLNSSVDILGMLNNTLYSIKPAMGNMTGGGSFSGSLFTLPKTIIATVINKTSSIMGGNLFGFNFFG